MDKQSLPPSLSDATAPEHSPRFRIAYCLSCGYRQRAVRVAAELEETLQENSAFVEGSNGIFEVEDRGIVIFSYKETGRFPDTGEIAVIAQALDSGVSLEEAKKQFATKAPSAEGFEAWFMKAYGKHKKRFSLD